MSSRSDRYASRCTQHPPPKKNKTDSGKGKKKQVVPDEDSSPPLLPASALSGPTASPHSTRGIPSASSGGVRTNLVRLGMDVPLGATIRGGGINPVELAAHIAPRGDVDYLASLEYGVLQERYLKHLMQAMLEGQVLHAQRDQLLTTVLDDIKSVNHQLQMKEGELRMLRKEREALAASLKLEREAHERTRTTALQEAKETYKRSPEFKDDVMVYMSDSGAAAEFLKSKVGQEAVEAESQIAFEIGRYMMQQQVYPVLCDKVPGFDPLAMGLHAMIEENPDPDAQKDAAKATNTHAAHEADPVHEQIIVEDITEEE